jgi:hypothetical protein
MQGISLESRDSATESNRQGRLPCMAYELRNVKDPSAVPDLLEIFGTTSNEGARFEALLALLENIKDTRVVPLLGPTSHQTTAKFAISRCQD